MLPQSGTSATMVSIRVLKNTLTPFHLGPFYPHQPNGHALPIPARLARASPVQPSHGQTSSQQQQSPPGMQHHQLQGPNYALPALGPAVQHHQQSPLVTMNNERERERERDRDRDRESDMLANEVLSSLELRRQQERDQHQSTHETHTGHVPLSQRQSDMLANEVLRSLALRRQQERDQHQSTHETHTGSIPLQQPVASRVPATLHGPNGILSNLGAGAGPNPPSAPLGAPSGPGNVFANGMLSVDDSPPRAFLQQTQQNLPPQQLLGFSNTATPQQLPNGMATLSQGQQPILNVSTPCLDFLFHAKPLVMHPLETQLSRNDSSLRWSWILT